MDKPPEFEEQTLEREFVETTTLHGVPWFWDSRRPIWLRLFWCLSFLACLGTGLWQITLRINEFRKYETNTKVTLESEYRLDFPAVTICNFNRYMSSKVSDDDWPYLHYALFAEEYDYDSYEDNGNFEQSSFDYDALFDNSTFNFTEFTLKAGFILDNESLLGCKWKGRECDLKNFTHVFTSYGNCWTFNNVVDGKGELIVQEQDQPGAGNGLSLVIDIQQDEYTETLDGNLLAGLKILAHEPHEPPLMNALGSAIPPGFYAYMALRKTEHINIGGKWGECDKDKTLRHYRGYTLSGCIIECKLEYILSECHCRPVRYPGNADVCSPQQTATCVKDVVRRYKDGILKPCFCPVPCNYEEYSSSISYGAYPSQSVAEEIETYYNFSTEYQSKNIVVLDIFYDQFIFHRYQQLQDMSVSSLISDIGGNLGLFVGASILTFGEFIDYLLRKTFRTCISSKKKNMPSKIEPVWGEKTLALQKR